MSKAKRGGVTRKQTGGRPSRTPRRRTLERAEARARMKRAAKGELFIPARPLPDASPGFSGGEIYHCPDCGSFWMDDDA